MTEEWLLTRIRRPLAPVRLYCLPHAGGGAGAYVAWPAALGPDIEVSAVVLPGRERRMAEPPGIDPAAVAAAIAEDAGGDGRPFAVFGHSLGARLGFEVVRELRRGGHPLPVRLLVSGCAPPDEPRGTGRYDGLSLLEDAEMLDRIAAGGGIPEEVLAVPELLELLAPVFRSDFEWLDSYVYREEPALPVALTAFAGDRDTAATPDQAAGWRRHTSADFELRVVPGGHFFPHDRLGEVAGLILAALRGAIPAGGTEAAQVPIPAPRAQSPSPDPAGPAPEAPGRLSQTTA
jgi:surfactin synthase thioesterase subunit